ATCAAGVRPEAMVRATPLRKSRREIEGMREPNRRADGPQFADTPAVIEIRNHACAIVGPSGYTAFAPSLSGRKLARHLRGRAARHDEVCDQHLNDLVALVASLAAHADRPAVRARAGWGHLLDFAHDAQNVPRPGGLGPTDLAARPDDAAGERQSAL